MSRWLAACAGALALAGPATAQPAAPVPDFSGYWAKGGDFASTWEAPENLKPGPLMNTLNSGLLWAADPTNPILKPKTADVVKRNGDSERGGVSVPVAHNLCWPEGVPAALLLREPVQFLQTPKEITILYQRDHQVRRVYMDVPHSKNPPKTWNGESVGHYEGDTLVIDTIGLNDKTAIDRFGTPHSDQLHVIERYQMINNGRALRATVTVEDPVAFTEVWYAQATYQRNRGPIEEIVCAENNFDILTKKEFPVPRATKADF
jgi:hypothetical protein